MRKILTILFLLLAFSASASKLKTVTLNDVAGLLNVNGLLGSTVTTINGTDRLTDSRSVINTNFSNLNSDKLEAGSSASTLTVTALTTTATRSVLLGLDASGVIVGTTTPYAATYNATSTTASSTFANGIVFTGGTIKIPGLSSCNTSSTIKADSSGNFICATDAVGVGVSGTTNRLSYFDSGTSIASANSFVIDTANGSTTFPTLNLGTLTATTGTSYINALSLGTALSDANIASAATWNAKQAAISVNSPITLTGATLAINTAYQFTAANGSTTWPTINVGTLTATTGTSYINALSLGTALTVANGGTGQTSFTAGNLLYGSASGGIQNVGTSTASCTTGVSCSSFTVVGGVAPSITATLGTSVDLTAEVGATILPVANGGTNNTVFSGNSLITSAANGLSLIATGSQLTVGNLVASTTATSTFAGPVGIGSGFIKGGILTSTFPFFASSTLAYYSTNASATIMKGFTYPVVIQDFYCRTNNGGTANAIIGTGAASSSMISISGTRAQTSPALAVTDSQDLYLVIGTFSATAPTGWCSINYYRSN